MTTGVDVSDNQGTIDWVAARAAGVEFVYIKATEGIGYVDPDVDHHLNGARAAGILPGLYHFARPDTNSPEADAASFASALTARGAAQAGWLPPCLDLERDAPVNMIAWSQRFLATVREQTGHGPAMLYANTSWWQHQLGGGGWLDDQTSAWVAHYGRDPGEPGWKGGRAVMHQYADDGRIEGYPAGIDMDYCWVDLSALSQGGTPGPIQPVDPRPDGWYTVKPGDNLSAIGAKLGVDWHDLASWNSLADPNTIYPGQRLRLTAPGGGGGGGGGGGTYTVAPGDTLSAIGAKLGVDWHAIYAANQGLIGPDPNRIQVGWVLTIPAGGATPAPAPAQRTYTVQSGDTLSGIAEKAGVAGGWQALYDANRDTISNPNVIHPGQVLRLP
jgi:GH25 family lysozyme M1 (1,4-beta-N-acetylmuramidase)/LysM repeat protein